MTNIPGPLIINLDSTYILDEEVSLLKSQLIGGVILFEHNYHDVNQIKLLIQNIKNINDKLKIFIDHEGGRVQRFKTGLTHLPSFEIIGNVYNSDKNIGKELSYCVGYVAGYELKTLGIDINFSPVVDLRISSDVMKGRTFADNGNDVVDLVKPYLNGLIENGIIPTLKHFPGHGSSNKDSHLGLVDVTQTYQEKELKPFKDIINDNYKGMIMTAHIMNKNIDKTYPATLSKKFIQEKLRKELNFKGVVVSDDMAMGAIVNHFGFENALNLAINATCDMLILSNNGKTFDENIIEKTVNSIYNSIKNGKISIKKLEKSNERIKILKESLL